MRFAILVSSKTETGNINDLSNLEKSPKKTFDWLDFPNL